ncbi:AraC family transcriptional regulator [Paenibacillus sp. PAMC21692]|nr:AraC family transcriptional regulator [Paenibacillus sp. PAMC21692]
MDGQLQQVGRFCVLHGGREGRVTISAPKKGFVCYWVSYRPLLPLDGALAGLAADPARSHYTVVPDRPLVLLRLFTAMHKCWQQPGPLQQLHVRGYFYTFVQQLLLQLQDRLTSASKADVVTEALHYLEEHFLEPITLEQLSEQMDSSARHLARLFKNRTGLSPIDYVIRMRMDYAKQLLQVTDATVQEIASGIGYADSYSFSKMFKKHIGIPPVRYRSESAACAHFPEASVAAVRRAPYRPKRVVVLYLLGDVLSFDVAPVGISDIYEGSSLQQRLNGSASLGEWYKPKVKQIKALRPDLIIAPSIQTFEMLQGVAPVVHVDYEWPIEQRMNHISEWLGSYNDFSQRMEQFHEKIDISKRKLREAGLLDKTVTIMEGGKNGVEVVASKFYGRGSHIIYHYLGMKAPERLQSCIDQAVHASGLHVPFDQLDAYTGDFVFRSTYAGMPNLSEQEAWNRLTVVREGRLLDISFGLSYYNDLYSLDQQLTHIVDGLLATAR